MSIVIVFPSKTFAIISDLPRIPFSVSPAVTTSTPRPFICSFLISKSPDSAENSSSNLNSFQEEVSILLILIPPPIISDISSTSNNKLSFTGRSTFNSDTNFLVNLLE